ncbi:choice-of-anchor I family protein [Cohnella fermenti]|uniref:choice-of-anchor I family protein n=1 Tax=Cohnella fermenti TaxID=2565925 RepID=UPI001454E18A|nr:choice-of-anchor I family protein [Cohnella fermenti]
MNRSLSKIISATLAAQLSIGALLAAVPAANAAPAVVPGTPYISSGTYDVTVPHIVIQQVYGAGLSSATDAYASHGFIELFNPTDSDVSLDGWSLQYADRSGKTGPTGNWEQLNLSGTIKAKSSYLVRAKATGTTGAKVDLSDKGDLDWDRYINNKGLKVVLMSNDDGLSNDLKNPFAADPLPEGYVDMLGTGSNDSGSDIDGYETDYPTGDSAGTSKKKSLRRIDFQDTDNNKNDFRQVDYSSITDSAYEANRPHDSEEGAWADLPDPLNFETTSLPAAYANQPYTASIGAAGGVAPYTFSATGLPEGLSLSTEGAVYGTPTAVALGLPITFTVTDSATPTANVKSVTLSLNVDTYRPTVTDTLSINKIADYSVGATSADGGVAEIVKFNKDNGKFYLVNGSATPPSLDIVSLGQADGTLDKEKSVLVAELAEQTEGFAFGDLTSVDVNTTTKRIYAAVQEEDSLKQGLILELDYDGNLLRSFQAGVQPDMVKSTKDGRYVLSADEGEPRDGINDPAGSVTIVDTTTGTSVQVYFDDEEAIADDVHIRGSVDEDGIIRSKGSKADAYLDFEPEYITLSSDNGTAYVSLQENNAIATIDIGAKQVVSVKSLGYKDFSEAANALDVQSDSSILLENVPFKGTYMPDGIASYSVNGVTYLLTANEGDATEWPEEDPIRANIAKLGDIKASLDPDSEAYAFVNGTTKYDGVEVLTDRGNDSIYMLGGRSFSIWNADTLEQVYDSGSDFEVITSQRLPEYFNASNSKIKMDDRSTKKGPEPEDIKTGVVGNHIFAFVGLERVGGIMTYDITNPTAPTFVNYTNSRVFADEQNKVNLDTFTGPEGLEFIPAEESPTGRALLLVAFEVGGKVGVYELETTKVELSRKTLSLTASGSGATLTAAVTPVGGSEASVTWSSSNTAVATITENGVVSPLSAGTAVIRAVSADGYGSAEAVVTVAAAPVVTPSTPTNPTTTEPDDESGEETDGSTTNPTSPTSPTNPTNPGTNAPSFVDVSTGHWASEVIAKLASKGIMQGMPDGSFQPNKRMTRAEYMAVLARLLGLDTSSASANVFKDVPSGKWYSSYINVLAEQGIAGGFADGTFHPDQDLTREEAFVLLYRAMKDKLGSASGGSSLDSFKDNANVSSWAREAVSALVQAGVLQGGTDGKLNPKLTITRAEIAKIVASFLD